MFYVLQHIFMCLLAAALLGGLIGWLLRGFGFGKKLADMEADWSGRLGLLEADNGKLATQWKEAESSLSAWKQKFATLDGDHNRLQADFSGVSARLPVLETAITGWTHKAAAWDADRTKLQTDLRACADARSALEVQLAEWTTRGKAWDTERSTLRANLNKVAADDAADDAAYEKTITALRSDLAGLQLKLKHSEIAANEWQLKHSALDTQMKTVITERDQAAASLKKALADDAADDAAYEKTIAALRAENASLQAQYDKAVVEDKSKDANYESVISRLRAEITAAQARIAELEAKAVAPLAMAAAAGAGAVSTVEAGRYTELQGRLQSFVLRTQREGWGDIERIEGIGPVYGQKLRSIGIAWVKDLLEEGAAAAGRARIVEESGIKRELILKWVNAADLLRIPGVTPDWAELLEASGVDTVKELRGRVPDNLQKKMAETNPVGNYARAVPDTETVRGWVDAAKKMEPKVSH